MTRHRSRAPARLRIAGEAVLRMLSPWPRSRPAKPASILVLHDLLLGDTLMLAGLLAALRARYPHAALYVTARPELLPLFSGRPYGVKALPFSERIPNALHALAPARGCDLVLIPGDNRHALTARALGARWIVALEHGGGGWKNRLPDERVPFPETEIALPEIFALLAGPLLTPVTFRAEDWPAPVAAPFEKPARPYAVLHVGASTRLKYWPAERWAALAGALEERYEPVWSAGPQEGDLLRAIDPQARYRTYPGTLDLAQLWHLIAGAERLVTLDTGVAHLAKLAGTPTVCLYGPGSAAMVGRGAFWHDAPFREVTSPDFPCRDERVIFDREVAWARRCRRTRAQCPRPRCMEAISLQDVLDALPR